MGKDARSYTSMIFENSQGEITIERVGTLKNKSTIELEPEA